jgi:hypothetical protein
MSDHTERQGWDEDRIVLTTEGPDYTVYCSPEADGGVYMKGERISEETLEQHGAPFPFDIVFDGIYPREGEMELLAEEVGEQFAEQFEGEVDKVYETIKDSDDPVETIMDMDPESLK